MKVVFYSFFSGSNMTDMQCMLQKNTSTLLIAGHQDEIFELDLERHKLLKEVGFSCLLDERFVQVYLIH